MMTDPIADMLTRIRNALAARHERVQIPASRMKQEIAHVLREEGISSTFMWTRQHISKDSWILR